MPGTKILVIDHDQDVLHLISSRLEAREYTVMTCDSSEQALKLSVEGVPDLILLDSQMEKVHGEELAKIIKKNIFDYFIPIVMMAPRDKIADHIMGMHRGFDDFIMKPFNPLELQLRVAMNLKRVKESVQANPLTKLPGNIAIRRKIQERISSGEKYSVCYLDIDNFKSFNDKYGFDKGDDVIVQTVQILLYSVQGIKSDVFVGHVGGDDFIVVLSPDEEELFAQRCIKEFDRLIPTYYSKEDQASKEIVITNRRGKKERFPLMSISVAAVTNLYRTFSNQGEIAQTAAEVKKYLKTQEGSSYLRDRREQQLEQIEDVERLLNVSAELEEDTSEPLGQILLTAGLISEQQLQEALRKHFETRQRLGKILIRMNAVSSEKVGQMLEKKLGVPYATLRNRDIPAATLRTFTAEYVRAHGVVPLRLKENTLHVAMIDPFDIKTIDEIERITNYVIAPSIALEEEFAEFVEKNYPKE